MQFLSFLFDKHLDKSVLAIAIAVSVVLLTREENSKVATARAVSSFLLYPLERAEDYFTRIEKLQGENRNLRELVATLSHERERLLQFKDERNRLRKLLDMREDSFYRFLPCEVSARSSSRFHHSITVDRGSRDGVRVGMAVVGCRGLAGRVSQVFPDFSRILLLNNKAISVSCLVKRSRVVGILEWERGNLFRLEYIGKEEDVEVGDTLVTSGLGRLFPKGFLVGTAFQVTEEKGGLSRKVGVVSMVDLNALEELFVVIGGRGWDNEDLYDQLEEIEVKER
ncbi:MAG: rod shape-determining protein MreC [bacterium]|nr:MAG: rod shape-determining protein MreC [bacterium]